MLNFRDEQTKRTNEKKRATNKQAETTMQMYNQHATPPLTMEAQKARSTNGRIKSNDGLIDKKRAEQEI